MRHPRNRQWLFVVLAVPLITLAVGWYNTPVRQSLLLSSDLILQPPFSLVAPFGPQASRTIVEIPYSENMTLKSIMVRPDGPGNGGAVILVPGYLPTMADPLLDRLAQDLAHLGFTVLIPEMSRLRQGLVTPEDVEVLVTAFLWFSEQPNVDPQQIGFAGFCIGGSLAMVAAADYRINQRVSYIHIFGGYFDARSAFQSIGTHTMVLDDQTIPWQPAPQAVSLYLQNVLMHIENEKNRRQIEHALQTNRLVEMERLDPESRQVFRMLTARHPDEMEAQLSALPVEKQAYFAAISPSHSIAQIKAKVFIMHDRTDPYMPVVESYRLVNALTPTQAVVVTYFDLFNHVRPSRLTDKLVFAKEYAKLVWHISKVLDAMSP